MNINAENRFNIAPTVTAPRSRFLMHQNIRTTFNAGELIPFYVDSDIMPGDTFKIKGTFVVRQSTPIYPTMDNSFLDVFFFFIPHRLVWDHWKEFWGENTTGSWTQQTTYTIPQVIWSANTPIKSIDKGSIANYMGLPITGTMTNTNKISVSALPFRAYQLTWNEWFRDENVTAPTAINKGDVDSATISGIDANYGWGHYTTNTYGGKHQIPGTPAPVYKYKDYFNACLLEPQKGAPITLPIGESAPIAFQTVPNATESSYWVDVATGVKKNPGGSSQGIQAVANAGGQIGISNFPNSGIPTTLDNSANLYADLSNAVAATINAQRMAFAAQRILEAKARSGSRYTEIIRSFWGVTSPDARQQRPEFLGARHIPISMNQVAQTSSTDSTSPQGNVAAFSLTIDSEHIFTKSFTEHGTILGLLCVRTEHSYDQGINRMWSRKNVLDFYQPQMAFLGEQAVLRKEIYATGVEANDNTVFGFNERWAELRYKPNINTGAMSTQYAQSLDPWHYGDSYSAAPVLSDAWRRETKDYIDRTLAVQSSVEDQYIMDSRLEFDAIRCLPQVSVPGLLDHF